MARAIQKRQARQWYKDLCLHAQVRGAQVTKTFAELFPEYTEDEEAVDVSPEDAKLMERLAAEQLRRAEDAHARGERTSN